MNKKAFTFMELMLVMVIISIIAASSVPFMFRFFGSFNEVTQQESILKSLQEISTVITRRVILDSELASVENLNSIINSFAVKSNDSSYELPNGITIKKIEESDIEQCSYTKNSTTHVISSCLKVTLTANKNSNQHKLSFILYPANK